MAIPTAFMAGAGYEWIPRDDLAICERVEKDTDEQQDEPTDQPTSDLTVGAHYYPWYGRGTHVDWPAESPEQPVLGSYDARDPEIIAQHLEWCQDYGVDWLSMSWWGQNSPEDITIRDYILEQSLGETTFSIFYETPGMLTADSDGTFNLSSSQNREQLISDVEYLSDTYFTHPAYRRIDGRPVFYLYIAREYRGDIAAIFDALRDASADGLYIIADLIRFGPPLDTDDPLIEAADAVTSYSMYSPLDDINDRFVERATDVYDYWTEPLAQADTEFMPVVLPGYDDSELTHVDRDNPPLEASPELFREFCREAQPYVTDGANSIFITSFNEWYENTQIEPSERYGTAYLDIVREEFGSVQQEPSEELIEVGFQFDRTVPEDELVPGITDPRELAVQCFAIELRDETGSVITSYNIGTENSEPEFGIGAYPPEQLDDVDGEEGSWRWFGGEQAETTLYVSSQFNDAHSLVLRGGAAEGDIDVSINWNGILTDSVTIEGRSPDDHEFSLTEPSETAEIELQFDRTVSEDELESGITDPRELAVQCFAIELRNAMGNVITSYNIGTENSEPEFGIGAYPPEQLDDVDGEEGSWRWFGGDESRTTLQFVPPIPDAHSLLLRGNAAEGEIQVSVLDTGEQTDTVTIVGRTPTDYVFSL